MGNASPCCGGGNGERKRAEETGRAIRATDAVCADLQLRRRTDEQGRYIRRTGKWSFGVVDFDQQDVILRGGIIASGDRRYRLELFEGPIDKVNGGNFKWLHGDNFMPFSSYSVRHNYACFLYETQGNVRQYISDMRMALGRDRELVIVRFLPDIFAGLKDLDLLGFHHSALSWDAIDIDTDGHARIGSLEYLIDRNKAAKQDLTDIRHLPPESLKCCGSRDHDIAKMETWIIGSLLLEILLHKHISGQGFSLATSQPSRRVARRNIKENAPRLPLFLDASSLSPRMRDLIKGMLNVDPDIRIDVDQALRFSTGGPLRSRPPTTITGSTGTTGGSDGLTESQRTPPQPVMQRRYDGGTGSPPRRDEFHDDGCIKEVGFVRDCQTEDLGSAKTSPNLLTKCLHCAAGAKSTICREDIDTENPVNGVTGNDQQLSYPIVTEPDEGTSMGAMMVTCQHPDGEKDPNALNMVATAEGCHGNPKLLISIKFSPINSSNDQMTSRQLQIEGAQDEGGTPISGSPVFARAGAGAGAAHRTSSPSSSRTPGSSGATTTTTSSTLGSSIPSELLNIDTTSDLYKVPQSSDISSYATTDDTSSHSKTTTESSTISRGTSHLRPTIIRKRSNETYGYRHSQQARFDTRPQDTGNDPRQNQSATIRHGVGYNYTTQPRH